MQIAATFDTGTAGREFISALSPKDQDNDLGWAFWSFDDSANEALLLISALFQETKTQGVIFVFFVADDNEDITQYV